MRPQKQTRHQRFTQIIGNSIIHSYLYWLVTNLYTLEHMALTMVQHASGRFVSLPKYIMSGL